MFDTLMRNMANHMNFLLLMVILLLISPSALNGQEPWSRSSDNDYDPQLDRFYNPAMLHRHNQPPDPIITFAGREDRLLDTQTGDNAEPSDLDFLTQSAPGVRPLVGQHAQFTDWNNLNSGGTNLDSKATQRGRPNGQIILDELGGPISVESGSPSSQYSATQYQGSQYPSSQYPQTQYLETQNSEFPVPDGAVLLNAGFQQDPEQQFPDDFRGMSTEYNGYSDYGVPQDNSVVPVVSQRVPENFQPIRQVEPPHFSSQNGRNKQYHDNSRRPESESAFTQDLNQDQTEKREPLRAKQSASNQGTTKPKQSQSGGLESSSESRRSENSDTVSWSDNVDTTSGINQDQGELPSRLESNSPKRRVGTSSGFVQDQGELPSRSKVISPRRRIVNPSRDQFPEPRNPVRSRQPGNLGVISSSDNVTPPFVTGLSQDSHTEAQVPSRPRKNNHQVTDQIVLVNQGSRQSQVSGPNSSGFGQMSQQQQAVRNLGSQLARRPQTTTGTSSYRDRAVTDRRPQYTALNAGYQTAGTQSIPEYFPKSARPQRQPGNGYNVEPNSFLASQVMQQYQHDRQRLAFLDREAPPQNGQETYGWQEPMRRTQAGYNKPISYDNDSQQSVNQEIGGMDGSGFNGDTLPSRRNPPQLSRTRYRSLPQLRTTPRRSFSQTPVQSNHASENAGYAMSNMFDPDPTSNRLIPVDQRVAWQPSNSWQTQNQNDFSAVPSPQQTSPWQREGVGLRNDRPLSGRRTESRNVLEPALPPSDFDRRFPVFTNDQLGGTQRRVAGGSKLLGKTNPPWTGEPGYVPVGKLRRFLYETSKLSGSSHESTGTDVAGTEGDKVEPGYGPPNPDDTNDIDKTVKVKGSSQDAE